MLRATENPRTPPAREEPQVEMAPYYVEAGKTDGYCETILTFEPSENDASSHSQASYACFSPIANDKAAPPASPHNRGYQQVPALPALATDSRAQSPARSPTKELSKMPLTGDGRGARRQDTSPGRFAGWLSASSTPPVDEPDSPTPKSKRGMSADSMPRSAPSATTQSRFGFLASSVSAITTRLTNQQSVSPQQGDELFDLNVEAALYPSASPTDRDIFSPAAYRNLQTNATGILLKMQNAYRQRTIALRDMEAERSAEREASEEATMRVENLKMQLEHMAHMAAEQERSMRQLMEELKAERMARGKLMMEGSVVSEDLGVDVEQRKKWRKSSGTEKSDVSFDTDEESAESESVFSRSRSPTSMISVAEGSLDLPHTPRGKVPTLGSPPKSKSDKEMTTFQKLMKNISGEIPRGEAEASDSCRNCHGQDSSVAWDTVGLLRDENRGLKHRVAELEVAVESVLDVVNGIGL